MAYKDKQRERENHKRWCLANPEKVKAYQKRSHANYRMRHREKCLAQRRAYYWKNHERELEKSRAYQRAHPELYARYRRESKEKNQGYLRHRQYGLTDEAHAIMLASQGGICAICRKTNPNGRALSVDHDHVTGIVRGLLCLHCNSGLGQFRDNAALLRDAVAYMERSP